MSTVKDFGNLLDEEWIAAYNSSNQSMNVVSVSVTNSAPNSDGLQEKLLACTDKTLDKLRIVEV
jgi:hypothetical protein